MKQTVRTLLIFLFLGINGLVSVFAQDSITYSLLLTGNTAPGDNEKMQHLFRDLTPSGHASAIVLLGNYSVIKKNKARTTLQFFPSSFEKNTPLLFTNGLNEWSSGKKNTKKIIKALHLQFPDNEVYTTDWGCPGPAEVQLSDKLTVILIDTYWWLTPLDTRYGKCGIENDKDVFIRLQDALRRNKNKTVVVAGFHPLDSYGTHAGYFPIAVNIFGFPYAIYRNTLGRRNDFAYPDYKNLRRQMASVLKQFPNVIYASSLENSLQYIKTRNIHQIISGSLTKQAFVKKQNAGFASSKAGISRIDVYKNGDVVLNFFTIENGPKNPVFSKKLFSQQPQNKEKLSEKRQRLFTTPTHTACASKQYAADKKKEKWMGKNYRNVWETPVEARVFDITKEKGGLTILKRGGGQQTKSIRMETTDGRQYVLRSLEKFTEGALPREMTNTFAKDIVQDQISASNPYAALPAAVLAKHAGIFHTNPEVVYVPQDPLLQQYKEDMRSGLFLLEERPTGNRSDLNSFGNSKSIVGTDEVIEKTTGDEDHLVDQHAVLRARLLDIYINDWDRHDDQWRWASFKKKGKTIYQPIPRDRDQTFFVNQGILPRIASLPFILPKIQNFQPRTKYIIGLGFNARYFDRTFLTQMEWKDWKSATNDLMQRMTPRAIDEAMRTFPKEVQPLVADSTAQILLERKKYMKEMAHELYLYLAKRVNVTGTNKRDIFEINRKTDNNTEVNVFHRKKDGSKGQQIFHRTFHTNETREIVCYGLKAKDRFVLKGNVKKGPIVRIIGGQDKDVVIDSSSVAGLRRKNIVYDLKKSTVVKGGKETKKELSDNKVIHEYNRKYFKPDRGMPLATAGYNADDGIYLGFGRLWYRQHFRRDAKYSILGDYAIKNSAYNIKAKFESISTNNGLDYIAGFEVSGPNYTTNYFGLGNKTSKEYKGHNYKYFKTRQQRIVVQLALQKRFGKSVWARYDEDNANNDHPVNEHKTGISLKWKISDTKKKSNKFISNFAHNGLTPGNLGQKQYAIIGAYYNYQRLNKDFRPTRGFTFSAAADRYINLQGNEPDFTKIIGSYTGLLSFHKNPRTVFAFRAGGEKIFGDYYFHDAAILDGKTNLRGYRKTRFYGDACAYFNAELRIKLIDFKNYILTGELGLLLFNDVGRVWLDGENSNQWHNGYGGGFWLSPFKMAIVTATINHSKEDNLLQFKFSYMF